MFETTKGNVSSNGQALSGGYIGGTSASARNSARQQSFQTLQSGLPLVFRNGRPVLQPETPSRAAQLAIKRLMDIVLSAAALVAFAPLLIAVALAIKLSSPGPILFRQQREGLRGAPIVVYKFRTMYSETCDLSGIIQTTHNDPRVTPFGLFLRRASIDELPQLFNVLKGEMSLIGPRPHAFNMLAAGVLYTELVPYYRYRQLMKPGLSGWAQANGYRGPTNDPQKAQMRVDHDIAYVQNFSLWLDLRTIGMTIAREITGGTGG